MIVEIFSFFDTPVKVVLPDSTERISGDILSGDMVLSSPICFDADIDHYRTKNINNGSFNISIDDLKKCNNINDVIKYSYEVLIFYAMSFSIDIACIVYCRYFCSSSSFLVFNHSLLLVLACLCYFYLCWVLRSILYYGLFLKYIPMSKFKLIMISSIIILMIFIFMMIVPIFMAIINPMIIFAALAFVILGLFIIFKIVDYVDEQLNK